VIWGGIHGTCLSVERVFRDKTRVRLPRWLAWLLVFHIVVLAWILFRGQNLSLAGTFLSRFASPGGFTLLTFPVALAILVAIGGQLLPERPLDRLRERFESLSPALMGAGLAAVVIFVGATVPSQGVPPFIYF